MKTVSRIFVTFLLSIVLGCSVIVSVAQFVQPIHMQITSQAVQPVHTQVAQFQMTHVKHIEVQHGVAIQDMLYREVVSLPSYTCCQYGYRKQSCLTCPCDCLRGCHYIRGDLKPFEDTS